MSEIHVKICGITNIEDARVAIDAGADLLGFILYPKSPRFVEPVAVAEILKAIQDQSPLPTHPKTVGVFVNEPGERILAILAQTGLDYAQLHSHEPPGLLAQLAGRAFKVLRPTSLEEALAEAATFAPLGPSDGPALLIDAHDPHAYGGTGQRADWAAAAAVAQRHPGLLLAGGLTPENVATAIHTVRPWGVDVSSGVEAAPGRKEHARVRAFIAAAKQ